MALRRRIADRLELHLLLQPFAFVLFSIVAAYLWATGSPVPDELLALISAAGALFLGARIASAREHNRLTTHLRQLNEE